MTIRPRGAFKRLFESWSYSFVASNLTRGKFPAEKLTSSTGHPHTNSRCPVWLQAIRAFLQVLAVLAIRFRTSGLLMAASVRRSYTGQIFLQEFGGSRL